MPLSLVDARTQVCLQEFQVSGGREGGIGRGKKGRRWVGGWMIIYTYE